VTGTTDRPGRGDVVRVAVDNDFPVVAAGVAAMLANHSARVEVVDPDSAPGADIVLKDAFALTQDLADYVARVRARVVVFSASADESAVRTALEQGAAGYVHKSVAVEELLDALERVRSGERVVQLNGRSTASLGTVDWPGRAEGLSDRESEVLTLICQGLSNQQVAQALYLSINSVKTYIRMLYRKIGATSRSQAVIWGLQHGFTPSVDRSAADQGY
jgi:NarL family two-component system response regulator LiaR